MLDRQRGSNLDQRPIWIEAGLFDDNTVSPERQPFGDHQTFLVRVEPLVDVVRLADDVDGAGERQSGGIGDDDTQFAGIGLCELPGNQEDRERPSEHPDHYGGKLGGLEKSY